MCYVIVCYVTNSRCLVSVCALRAVNRKRVSEYLANTIDLLMSTRLLIYAYMIEQCIMVPFVENNVCKLINHSLLLFVSIKYPRVLNIFFFVLRLIQYITHSKPVSYTHLDVYKRQVCYCIKNNI